jgi:hypothetical protein
MTRSPAGVLLFLWLFLGAIGLAGCGGTETGNPSGPGGGAGGQNPAITLAEEICARLTSCFGEEKDFAEEDCVEAIAESETLGPAFGLDEEPPPGFGEVIDKVENSELPANDEAVAECLDAIDSLECEDPAVQAVDIEQGFENVEDMLSDASCLQVFSMP